jgi:hypothetical protein
MTTNNDHSNKTRILVSYRQEMQLAIKARIDGNLNLAIHHYERAHILSQKYTIPHLKSHLGMLRIGFLRKDTREIVGQCIRVVAALIFSKIWVPIGNTGGTNVSALRPMPIPEDLQQVLEPQ